MEFLRISVTRKGIFFFRILLIFFETGKGNKRWKRKKNRKSLFERNGCKRMRRGMYGFGCFVKKCDANSLLRKRKCEKFEEDIGGRWKITWFVWWKKNFFVYFLCWSKSFGYFFGYFFGKLFWEIRFISILFCVGLKSFLCSY